MLDTSRLRDLAVSDAGFVFDPTTGHTYNINSTALFVLNALKAGDAPELIVTNLAASFDVELESDLSRDVTDFVSRLREHGLVR
jgi:PqqD family protein of HPr-rel-A system